MTLHFLTCACIHWPHLSASQKKESVREQTTQCRPKKEKRNKRIKTMAREMTQQSRYRLPEPKISQNGRAKGNFSSKALKALRYIKPTRRAVRRVLSIVILYHQRP